MHVNHIVPNLCILNLFINQCGQTTVLPLMHLMLYIVVHLSVPIIFTDVIKKKKEKKKGKNG